MYYAKIEQLLNRIIGTDSERLIQTYESKIEALEEEKVRLKELAAPNRATPKTFNASFRTALSFLSNPYKLWASEVYEHKKLALRVTFADKLRYRRKEGY